MSSRWDATFDDSTRAKPLRSEDNGRTRKRTKENSGKHKEKRGEQRILGRVRGSNHTYVISVDALMYVFVFDVLLDISDIHTLAFLWNQLKTENGQFYCHSAKCRFADFSIV